MSVEESNTFARKAEKIRNEAETIYIKIKVRRFKHFNLGSRINVFLICRTFLKSKKKKATFGTVSWTKSRTFEPNVKI